MFEITCKNNNTIEMSRNQLIMWINSILKVNISKIQQLGTGSLYCQLLDILHPNKVPLNKINWKAKHDYEYVNNFKILQQCFNKFGIMKNIPVQKLIRCKYQDNLQFLQWFKKIFDTIQPNREYDPLQRRSNEIQLPPLMTSDRINRKDCILSKTREKNFLQRQRSISKIQSNTKNNDYRTDIQNSFIDKLIEDNLMSEKNGYSRQIQQAKSERDLYFNKLRDIDHVLDQFKYILIIRGPIQLLKQQIYKILLCLPQEQIHFNSDGSVSKRFKEQTPDKNNYLQCNDSKNIIIIKKEQRLSLEKNEQIKQADQKVDCQELQQQNYKFIQEKQSQEIKEQNIMMKQTNSQQKKHNKQ